LIKAPIARGYLGVRRQAQRDAALGVRQTSKFVGPYS
jgi:hypothetical protein